MKDMPEFDIEGLITDLVSEGYRRTVRAVMPVDNTPPAVDIETAVFVFDRLNESSLLAAALLKQYGNATVIEYDQIDKLKYDRNTHVVWINLQPLALVAKRMQCRHTCFIGNEIMSENWMTIKLVPGPQYDSVSEQVLNEILFPTFRNRLALALDKEENEVAKATMVEEAGIFTSAMKAWFGVGYLVEKFHTREPNEEEIVKAFAVIRMAHEYLYFGARWNPDVVRDYYALDQTDLYKQAVKESKSLLEKNKQTETALFVGLHGKLITTLYINETSYRWYIMKRLVMTSGQIWKAPIALHDRLFFGDNYKQKIAA
jgi:hypothetical protein